MTAYRGNGSTEKKIHTHLSWFAFEQFSLFCLILSANQVSVHSSRGAPIMYKPYHDTWVAAVTEPRQEYAAKIDLERLGLNPYIAQRRRSWLPPTATKPLLRSCPLFPGYIFLPLKQARLPAVHFARGLRRMLSDATGCLWQIEGDVIQNIAVAEHRGDFDETMRYGDAVTVRGALFDMVLTKTGERTAEVLLPLFGGCRATAPANELVRAA